MNYEYVLSVPVDVEALGKALLDPRRPAEIARAVSGYKEVEELDRLEAEGRVRRRVRFVANVEVPAFARGKVQPDMLEWVEESEYDRARRSLSYTIVPVSEKARERFSARGTQTVEADGTRARWTIRGELTIKISFIGGLAERFIASQLKKNYEEEVEVLRRLATDG